MHITTIIIMTFIIIIIIIIVIIVVIRTPRARRPGGAQALAPVAGQIKHTYN